MFRELMMKVGLAEKDQNALFDLIQQKSVASLKVQAGQLGLPAKLCEQLVTLPTLCGTSAIIEDALELFSGAAQIEARLENLAKLYGAITDRFENIDVYFDLSELRGYGYHTGIVFAGYIEGERQCIAKGGRYDDVGEVFGRARSATGFDMDAKALLGVVDFNQKEGKRVLAKPASNSSTEKSSWKKAAE